MGEAWLITGGCGFVGSNLAAGLLEDGLEVIVADNLARTGSAQNLTWLQKRAGRPGAGRFTFTHTDTRNAGDVESVVRSSAPRIGFVAHLAGQVAMTTSIERPRLDFEVNALGALNLLEALRLHAPGVVALFSSTNKVYGDLASLRHEETPTRWHLPDHPRGIDESLPLSFQSPYGCSKGAADQYFLDYHRIHGLKTIVFRHSSIYGGRQFATFDQGWVGWFCLQALRQRQEARAGSPTPFTISGDGKQVRDLLHAEDIVRCYRRAAERADACVGRAYNIGGGMDSSLSLIELFGRLESLVGSPMSFQRGPWRVSDQRVFVADGAAAERDFGFKPQVGSERGLASMMEWSERLFAEAAG